MLQKSLEIMVVASIINLFHVSVVHSSLLADSFVRRVAVSSSKTSTQLAPCLDGRGKLGAVEAALLAGKTSSSSMLCAT